MKATELMIGDWVLMPNSNNYENEKIVAIPTNTQIEVGGNCWINPMACKPILLTDDILKKNGFKNEKYHNEYDIDGTNFYVIEFCDTFSYQDTDMEIKYVHELQRALRLCGLNNLADNFKI